MYFRAGDRIWYESPHECFGATQKGEVIGFDTRWGLCVIIRLDGTTGSITTYPACLTKLSVLDDFVERVHASR
jgi:hypothetical protein